MPAHANRQNDTSRDTTLNNHHLLHFIILCTGSTSRLAGMGMRVTRDLCFEAKDRKFYRVGESGCIEIESYSQGLVLTRG